MSLAVLRIYESILAEAETGYGENRIKEKTRLKKINVGIDLFQGM
jgi:hypothetical protein